MRHTLSLLGICLLVAVAAVPASAETVEEIIAKHVEAHGGKANWDAIRSMRVTGTYGAFSKVHPFTMHRERPNKYHMDTIMDDKVVITGYDGETPWWDNHWLQEGAQEIRGADLPVLHRDIEFTTALMDYEAQGHTVKLLGEVEFEGIPTIAIELTRTDETVEKWYLDPKTYLEVGRESPGSDFGRAMEQRTFYDDFREVNGAIMPFFTETQWYTRDRVMTIEKVEVNVDIDDALFQMPLPVGMEPFRTMAGSYKVAAAQRQQPGQPWQESEHTSTIESLLGGGLIHERYTTAAGTRVVRSLTYDRFHKVYRMSQANDSNSQLDIQQGNFDDAGKLLMSNVETGTSWTGFGRTFHGRYALLNITENGFDVEQEISTDGGENWFLAAKATYTRAEE